MACFGELPLPSKGTGRPFDSGLSYLLSIKSLRYKDAHSSVRRIITMTRIRICLTDLRALPAAINLKPLGELIFLLSTQAKIRGLRKATSRILINDKSHSLMELQTTSRTI